jgi:MFS family permease|tara:strand:- start:53 stop:499 length:447 start_codon:yes stop_codon:yes gene_type:complete
MTQHIRNPGQLKNFGPRYVVFLLFLAYAFSFVDRQILSILFEPIKAEFDLSDTQLGFLGGIAFALTYSILGVPLAMLADRRGRKGIITASLAIFSIMTAFCGAAGSFATLALARIGVGIGEAGVNPSSSSMIADCVTSAHTAPSGPVC